MDQIRAETHAELRVLLFKVNNDWSVSVSECSAEVPKLSAPRWTLLVFRGGGGGCYFYEGQFIFNEIWTEDKIYISVGTLLVLNILLTT
jgi:hypothetical protein